MSATLPNSYNRGAVACRQWNRTDFEGNILGVADGDENVIIVGAEGDPAQSEYGVVTVTEAAQTHGNCYSSPAREKPNGADMVHQGCSTERGDLAAFYGAVNRTFDADGCPTGIAAPKKSEDCSPCGGASGLGDRPMLTEFACVTDCKGEPIYDDEGNQLWEVTVTGPFESISEQSRRRSSTTVANNGVTWNISLAENPNLNGGPGGVFLDSMLEDDGVTPGCWAWSKFLTPIQPPCSGCACAGDYEDGSFITAADVAAGNAPTPVG